MITYLDTCSMPNHKKHAEHNFEACEHLHKAQKGKFNDWVITTAFYSSLHYILFKAFPLTTTDGVKCKNIFEFRNYMKSKGFSFSKHEVNIYLVKNYLSQIYPHYKILYDSCNNARYTSHEVKDPFAELAYKSLLSIKKHCSSKK